MLQGRSETGEDHDVMAMPIADPRSNMKCSSFNLFTTSLWYHSTPLSFPDRSDYTTLGSLLVASLLRKFSRFDVMKGSRFCCADAHPLRLGYTGLTRSRSLSYSPPATIVPFWASLSTWASTRWLPLTTGADSDLDIFLDPRRQAYST